MRRSKYGYLLLALLVITGLAGTITSTSITAKERKLAAGSLKDSKNDLLKTVKDLSEAQLNFKAMPGKFSIKQCIYHLILSEKNLWNVLQSSLKQPANPEMRVEIKWTDEQLIMALQNPADTWNSPFAPGATGTPYKTLDEALADFKTFRADHIKYVKGTTEDLRNHVVRMPFGWIDCYQLCLVISTESGWYLQRIEEIKGSKHFPTR